MTAQASDRLVNEHPDVDLDGLLLYRVSAGLPEPPKINSSAASSNLWRGYIATFRLNSNGTFELLNYEIPSRDGGHIIQQVDCGFYFGDFTITLRPFFTGPNTVIPFVSGEIVRDRSRWKIDETPIHGWQLRKFKDAGYTIETNAGKSFIPNSLVPRELISQLESGHDGTAACEIYRFDAERNYFILRLLRLA